MAVDMVLARDSGRVVQAMNANVPSSLPRWPAFTLLCSAAFILASPLHIWRCQHDQVRIRQGALLYWKMLATISLVGMECMTMSLWATSSPYGNSLSVATQAFGVVCALLVSVIVYLKHCYAMRSSSLVTAHLFAGIVCDAAKMENLLSGSGLSSVFLASVAAMLLKSTITILEEIPKRKYLIDAALQRNASGNALDGFWTRYLLTWLRRTIRLGFKSVITIEDLANLDSSFASADLSAKFGSNLASISKESRFCLMHATVKTLPKQLILVLVPRLAYAMFTYLQPTLIEHAMSYMRESESRSLEHTRWGLMTGTVVIFGGIALFRATYSYHNFRFIISLRGCLMGQIFEKLQRLSYFQAKESSAMILMSADMDIMINGLVRIHDLWAAPVEIATGLFLLSKFTGPSSLYVLLPLSGCCVGAAFVADRLSSLKSVWNKRIEDRTAKTAEVLAQMKSLKMTGLESAASACIEQLRTTEVDSFREYRKLATLITVLAVFSVSMTPVLGMMSAVFWAGRLDLATSGKIFTVLSIIALIVSPIVNVLNAALVVPPTLASFVRMQNFLVLQELRDRRRFGDERSKQRVYDEPDQAIEKTKQTKKSKRKKQFPPILALRLSICLPGNAEYLLHLASFALGENSVTVLLGPTGSGKTILLRTLMGEVQYYGSIGISQRNIAYCGQIPWIQNASLRQNVVGPMRFDPPWYDTVMNACLLHEDIQQLEHGDATIVGTDGVAISGGQRQRVALARAVYALSQIIILDGVCSSLDESTTAAIFDNLFGEFGLLRKRRCTVILATNLAKYAGYADKVLVLDGAGGLTSQSRNTNATKSLPQSVQKSTAGSIDTPAEASTISAHHEAMQTTELEVNLEYDVRIRGNLDFCWFYLTSARWKQLFLYAAFTIIVAGAERLPHILLGSWLQEEQNNKPQTLPFIGLGASSSVLAFAMMLLYFVEIIPYSATAVHQQLLRTVMRAPLSFITSTDTNFVLNRFSQDMTILTQSLPLALHQLVYSTTVLSMDSVVIAMGAPYAVAMPPVLLVVIYFVQTFYLRTSRQLRQSDLEAKKPLYSLLEEATKGLEHVRSFMWRPQMLQRMFRALDRSQKATYNMFAVQRWLELILDLTTGLVAVSFMAMALYAHERPSETAFGLAMLALVGFGQGMGGLTQKWNTLDAALGAISRLRSFINNTPQEATIWGGLDPRIANLPKYGNIAFKDISAKYNATDSKNALNEISIEVDDGSNIGLIGRTGSGKSSVFAALLNLIEYRGVITIDGIDISAIPQDVLRSQLITTITQDPIKLPGSINDNLMPYSGQQADGFIKEFDVKDALRKVGLRDEVEAKGGLDCPMSDAEFTPGQMQMLSIARAMLHHAHVDSRIVLIDEATGSMDTELEDTMQPLIRAAFKKCTILIITHRPETLEDGEKLIEMGNGRILSIF